ncbi:hypothetical protein MKW92_003286 [Papaver armeniacum]|nr:hypothetical protein MKW92_003286 [Papaver armeniacum]
MNVLGLQENGEIELMGTANGLLTWVSYYFVVIHLTYMSEYVKLMFSLVRMNVEFELSLSVQASIAANTWVVSGSPQTKKLQDLLPGIINQLCKFAFVHFPCFLVHFQILLLVLVFGPDNLDNLRKLAEQFQKQMPGGAAAILGKIPEEDDDDVPDLMDGETFEAAADEEKVAS